MKLIERFGYLEKKKKCLTKTINFFHEREREREREEEREQIKKKQFSLALAMNNSHYLARCFRILLF